MGFSTFLIILFCAIGYHLLTYFGVQYLEGEPRTVGWKVDQRIPFTPKFVFCYISWFPALVVIPFLLYRYSDQFFLRYIVAYAADLTLSCIVFLCAPTTFVRPDVPKKGVDGFLLGVVYRGNHRFLNCAPSVHCSVSMVLGAFTVLCPGMPVFAKLIIMVWMTGIVCSTLFVKQHVLLDMLTAIPTAVICTALSFLFSFPKIG